MVAGASYIFLAIRQNKEDLRPLIYDKLRNNNNRKIKLLWYKQPSAAPPEMPW